MEPSEGRFKITYRARDQNAVWKRGVFALILSRVRTGVRIRLWRFSSRSSKALVTISPIIHTSSMGVAQILALKVIKRLEDQPEHAMPSIWNEFAKEAEMAGHVRLLQGEA